MASAAAVPSDRRKPLFDHRDVAADHHQQIVEIVRDAPGQLTQSLHLLHLRELRLGLLHRQLRLASLGDVARELGKAEHSPSSPRIGSITTLAQKRLPSLRTRQPSASNRPSVMAVCSARVGTPAARSSGIESREVLADDLSRRIALDALGAGIPAGDDTVRVQHVERIVGDAVYQQPELTLAFAQTLLGPSRSVISRVIFAKPIRSPPGP